MDDIDLQQPKEIVTTVSATCKHCGTIWDMSRVVERRNEAGDLVEDENTSVIQMCPSCNPNPPAPPAEEG